MMTTTVSTLAIDGGTKVRTVPFSTGRRYDDAERVLVNEALESQDLFYWSGTMTKAFCREASDHFGARFCTMTSSGTAAIHTAVASLNIEPGYEVITSPVTDYGTLIGLLYQNLIPVFADVDAHTYNITAASIRACITPRTKAIIVVHLAGNPCEMDDIMAIADEHSIPVVEDCAQSYDAVYCGRKVGTIGAMGCFSLNAFKHIGTGDGGFVLTNDEAMYYRNQNYADKCYDRHARGVRMTALAPCYRISELQSAAGRGQLTKLDGIITRRRRLGTLLTERIRDIDGIHTHRVQDHALSSYWFYMLRIDTDSFAVGRDRFSAALTAEGVPAGAGYIARPIYCEPVFREKSFFPGVWPAEVIAGKRYSYDAGLCPIAEEVLRTAIRLPIHESFSENDIEDMVKAIRKVGQAYRASR
ncbi:MAG: DegT/DnrJ/EryC1/StrS family aminotransferase [Spirochaetota bacterium]